MSWPEFRISDWEAFLAKTASLQLALPGNTGYLARGHACADWRLTPSLLRILPSGTTVQQAIDIEQRCLDEFKSQAHLHLPWELLPASFPSASDLEWWALMQHYQAPTRLLDWTASPFVATYFAVDRMWDEDGAIYIFHYKAVLPRMIELYGVRESVEDSELKSAAAPAAIYMFTPPRRSERLVAQQGKLTFSMNMLADQHEIIVDCCQQAQMTEPNSLYFEKWVIPAGLKPMFLERLRSMNIVAHSLFPGSDGLGRSAAEVARLVSIPR